MKANVATSDQSRRLIIEWTTDLSQAAPSPLAQH